MIQELVGAAGSSILLGEAKVSFNHHHLPQTSSTPTTPDTSNTNTTNSPSSTLENQKKNNNNNSNNNLRCPRCDSANTKFCYYNNYNLTQPRHFCKTCRRYWTKGGALRNVPIGGGCRKNKNATTIVAASKSSAGKLLKTISVPEFGRAPVGFDYELPPNIPTLWGSSPQSSSHLLTLLRSATTQNPNPSRNPTSSHVKEEKVTVNIGSTPNHLMSSTEPLVSTGARAMCLDHQLLPSLGLCTNSMWRSNNQSQHQQQNSSIFNNSSDHVHQNSGMQELYQRLIRSSATANYQHHSHSHPVMRSNAGSDSSYILESAPALGGGSELGYGWNPAFSWPDLSTTNGAYP